MRIRKQADRILPASDELYRGLFEHMLEGLAYCKMIYEAGEPGDFIYLEVNSAFEQLTGLTGVRGKLVSEVIPGIRASNPELFEIYGRVALTGKPEKFETYVDSLGIWFDISVYSPKPEHFVAVFENITERKQMEEALAKEQHLLQTLLDTVPDYIYFKDTESRFIRTSKAHAKAFGLSDPALVIGKSDFDFFTGEHAHQAYEDEQAIIRTGQPISKEEKETWADRPDTWVLTTKMPLSDRQGKIIGTLGISRDISGRKQAEEALRESEQRFHDLFTRSPDAILLIDPHHPTISWPIVDCNEVACQMNGYTRDDLIGQSIDILNITQGTNEERRSYLDRLRREGVIHIETLHRHKNGHLFSVEVSSSLLVFEGRELVLGIDRDITDRKQAQEAQLHYTSFLESLNYITRIVLEAKDLESTLKILVENIAKLFGADDAFFAFWDEDNKRTTPMLAHGSMSEIYPKLFFEPGERTLTAAVMEVEHPLAIPDFKSSTYLSPKVAALFPSHSMLGIPLIIQGKKLAALYLGYNSTHHFARDEIVYAESAAQQIALVLTKIQLLEDATKRVKQLTVLHEVAITATQVDTVDRLIEKVTEIIGRNLFPDNFGILLIDEERGVLCPHSSYRFVSRDGFFPDDIPLGQGVTGTVAKTGQSIRIGHVEDLKIYIDVDPGTSSELCVPIRLQDRVLGVINAESTRADAFSSDDELLLGTLAGQLATATEQIRTAQSERQWLDQLAHSNDLIYAIAQITTQIEKALTQEEIVQTLGSELRKLDLTCTMATYDKERGKFKTNYASIEPRVLEQMENGIGFSLLDSSFSLKKLNSILNNKDILHPAAITDPENEIQILLPRRRDKGIAEILQGIGIGLETELLRLPLVFEKNLLGILWVWGRGITESDLPILSIFAKQIGSSLERARLFQEVQSLALIDPLTGLQNRRSLFELGKVEFARSCRTYRPFCCLMLDLDHFKKINDTHGHPIGDEVLRQVAECAKRSIREVDLIGRYGGEEFLIFLPEADLVTGQLVAERLRASIEKTPIKVSDQELHVTVSIGVSRKDENTLAFETLIARADQAMYMAKHRGRNRVATSI